MTVSGMKRDDSSSARGKRMMPRSFRARNMPAALAAVEKALGSEALIVSVHPLPAGPAWKLWRRSGVEVVAMPSAVNPVAPRPQTATDPGTGTRPEKTAGGNGGSAVLPLRSMAEEMHTAELPPSLAALQERLLRQGVDGEWLSQALQSILEGSNARILGDTNLARELVRQEMHRRLRSDGGACLIRRKVIFLVGASGCGKTTVCAKIASYAMKALGKRVHWITADTTRAGAIAKAQAFTAPLGITLHLTYRPEELPSVLNGGSDSELFLVDTPGCNPYRKTDLEELDRLLEKNPDRHILWVAPATAKESDLQDTYEAFSHLGIGGVAVTRLDETRVFGALFNFLRRTQLPIAFLSHGPRIQGDLHIGETSLLVNLLLGEKPLPQ
jgi:flagellar biosynthesis GTPase FlhF